MAEKFKRNGQRHDSYPGSENRDTSLHNAEILNDRMVNFRIGENDTDSETNSGEPSKRAPKLTRNRRTKSLYGVSPNCKFGPCGSILESGTELSRSPSRSTYGQARTTGDGHSNIPNSDAIANRRSNFRQFLVKTSKFSFIFVAFVVLICPMPVVTAIEYTVVVSSSDIVRNLTHFWRSTGFCPPLPHQSAYDFDYGKDMKLNLALIGSTAHAGIEQVRIHWLLDLITVEEATNGKAAYKFTRLDNVIALLWQHGLKPGFEIMGNPSGIFTDFENMTQLYMWRDLVQQLARNYADQYGLSYVSTWNFETWNEPDCRDFDKLKITVQGFLNYYDASWAGLKSVSKLLTLGGPGDGCDRLGHSQYSDAFLNHVAHGKNVLTGENVSADFLSYHRKGSGSSLNIIREEVATLLNIADKYPSLTPVKFYNDEADPMVGWSKDEWWRADATYAAMVAKIIVQHQNFFPATKFEYALLSNDNGFLSYHPRQFTQRTLLARFQMNNTQEHYTQFVRKPVHAIMSLLALLGDKQLEVNDFSLDRDFGVLASYHKPVFSGGADCSQVSVLVYNSADTSSKTRNDSVSVTVHLDSEFLERDFCFVHYVIDNYLGNPYAVWEKYGKPDFPTKDMFREMRSQEGPIAVDRQLFRSGTVLNNRISVITNIPLPGIVFLHICAKSDLPPDQTNGLNIYNITIGQILITWSDSCVNSKCIYRYDVAYSSDSEKGPYNIVNAGVNSFVTSFVFAPEKGGASEESVRGFYRVRAVDYFGRPGEYSLPLKYPS